MKRDYVANAAGLSVLALLVAALAPFVPTAVLPAPLWMFIYALWSGCGLFVWQAPRAPAAPRKWLYLAGFSLLAAPFWYVFATLAGRLFFGSNEPALSNGFDLVVTCLLAPGFTFVAVAGSARALVSSRKSKRQSQN